jgi:hypothetical protein
VGVVQEPVNGRGREGLGHEGIEAGRMQVRRHRDRTFLVSGINEPIKPFGRVGSHFEQPDIIDHDEVGAENTGDGVVGADQGAEGLEEERLPGPEVRLTNWIMS